MKGIYLLLFEFKNQPLRREREIVSLCDMEFQGESSTLPSEMLGYVYHTIRINKNLDLRKRVITFFHELMHMDREDEKEFWNLNYREIPFDSSHDAEREAELERVYLTYEQGITSQAEGIFMERPILVNYVVRKYGLDRGLMAA